MAQWDSVSEWGQKENGVRLRKKAPLCEKGE